jgi:hypothetical protein
VVYVPKKKHRSSQSTPCLYTLKIELQPDEMQPPIWRRLVVDGRVSLAKLHHFIQAAMGWNDAHLHEFEIRDERYATHLPSEELDDVVFKDDRKTKLNVLLIPEEQFIYRYDLGDNWKHVITVESFETVDHDPAGQAWVIDGARACPPEDVGGSHGYHDFLESLLTAPHSDEAKELLQWAGGCFDAELFDRRAANAAIQRMLWNHWGGK